MLNFSNIFIFQKKEEKKTWKKSWKILLLKLWKVKNWSWDWKWERRNHHWHYTHTHTHSVFCLQFFFFVVAFDEPIYISFMAIVDIFLTFNMFIKKVFVVFFNTFLTSFSNCRLLLLVLFFFSFFLLILLAVSNYLLFFLYSVIYICMCKDKLCNNICETIIY